MQHQSTRTAQVNARALRTGMTDGERLLWSRLRGEQLGVKFRRQHPLGNYIADFVCLAPKLLVELDGSQHHAQQAYDAKREQFFQTKGFEVLRFASNLPFVDMDGVLQLILETVSRLQASAPSPTPAFAGAGSSPKEGKSKSPSHLRGRN